MQLVDSVQKFYQTKSKFKIKFFIYVFAGASPKSLPIFESAEDSIKDKITTFRTKDNFLDLEENVSNPKCKNVVVIGGGFLGSELACALARSCKFFLFTIKIFVNNL